MCYTLTRSVKILWVSSGSGLDAEWHEVMEKLKCTKG